LQNGGIDPFRREVVKTGLQGSGNRNAQYSIFGHDETLLQLGVGRKQRGSILGRKDYLIGISYRFFLRAELT
jgi:hypothetical protein